MARLLDLARDLDLAGRPHGASLLVGAAYALYDEPSPDGGSGQRRAA